MTGVSTSTTAYTMEFWVYMNNYVPGQNTQGFSIAWDKQLLINMAYTSGSYFTFCYPIYDSTDNSKKNSNNFSFRISPTSWSYIRCSVDLTAKTFFSFDESSVVSERVLFGTGIASIPATTTLTFTENSLNRGVVFFRQFRLWNCYLCQNVNTYKLDITTATIATYTNLLHLWDPLIGTSITDIKGGVNVATLTQNSNWVGNNVIDDSNYTKLAKPDKLCDENATNCPIPLMKFNQYNDIKISKVPPATHSRYTLEFWTMVSSISNFSSGVHVIWKNLVSVSMVKDSTTATTLNIYCWPQDFKMNLIGTTGSSINALTSTAYNYDSVALTSYGSSWVWVRCAVNGNDKIFYHSTNAEKTLKSDLFYKDATNSYPFRYMFQNNELTYFTVAGANNNSSSNIYFRNFYLFNDFIPSSYTFKNQ